MPSMYKKSLWLFIVITVLSILWFNVLRICFYILGYEELTSNTEIVTAFYIGCKFDVRLALFINLPFLLLGIWKFSNPFGNSKAKYIWLVYFTVIYLVIFLLYLIDFVFYDYLGNRVTSLMFRYFYNPDMVLGMFTSGYPFVLLLTILVVVIISFLLGFNWLYKKVNSIISQESSKTSHFTYSLIAIVIISGVGLYGKVASFPLTWSDAYFSTHSFVSALATNPILHLGESLFWEDPDYDIQKVRKYYPLISEHLGVKDKDIDNLNFDRAVIKSPPSSPPNIVIVFMESLAFHKSGLANNPLNPTPNFDKLAQESLYFKRFFTPHRNTARSIFAAVIGLPDIGLIESSSRNPMLVKQHTVANSFKGYEKFYFLGGSANWSNIRGIISHNIDGLKLFEEHMYDSPKLDVWGISDLHLFENFIDTVNKSNKPFLAFIQTSGNHSPFLISDDNRGFKIKKITKEDALKNGFKHSAEYNSLRFLDHSFGIFIEDVKKQPFFKNTIFCFFGDHGKRVYHHELSFMPKSEHDLNLTHYHVPFIIYAPHLLEPAVYDYVASELDILPTMAGLASISYENKTLGRNLFDSSFDTSRFAFTLNYSTNDIGIIDQEYYFLINITGKNKRLHSLTSQNPLENLLILMPQKVKEMEDLCFGFYETAKYMRSKNALQEK